MYGFFFALWFISLDDYQQNQTILHATVDLHAIDAGGALRGAAFCFYLNNEGLSLLENVVHLGLPVLDKRKAVPAQLDGREDGEK